jgi:DNA (cytosine-5)-methyltransferase 1
MTGFSRLSQFGMTYKPLTENLGQELLMSYLVGFHAKTLAPQEKAQELVENGQECGNTWQELLAKYDPNLSLWKTPPSLLDEDLVQSLEIWPRWGSMRNGECFQQPKLVQTISVKESGFVPNNQTFFHTPCTTGLDGGSNSRKALKKRMEQWPTPLSSEHKGNQKIRENHQNGLTALVGGRLNPMWVEWLMGWPLGWTDLKPLETDKYHFVQQQLGDC